MELAAAVPASRSVPLPGGRWLDLGSPRVMGVLNVTPDSFSDGGRYLDLAAAVARAEQMAAEGAAVIDVGGESTRPGAAPVEAAEELARVLPVLEALAGRELPPLSIDTRKAEVARAALAAGAALVNDVSCLSDPDLAGVCAAAEAPLVIGHIRGTPADMQRRPRYADVLEEVQTELGQARQRALDAGLQPNAVLLDPGIGFGKTLAHNLSLLRGLPRLRALGPLVVGVSRKSMLGTLLGGREPGERLSAGLGAAVWAALHGADLIRTHDVLPTVDALRVVAAIRGGEEGARVD